MPDTLTENDLRKYCVTYNSDSAEKVRAAYFQQDGELITFKNHDHKIVMAVRRDMVISVRDTTDDVAVSGESDGRHTVVLCSNCGGSVTLGPNQAL